MAGDEELAAPWGRLVCEGGEEMPVLGDRFTIGRGKASDFEISDNKYVSSLHCELVRGAGGRVHLRDRSSNGTLVNGARVGKGNEVAISNGDVIAVVFRKDNPKFNVEFKYEEIGSQDDGEGTLEYEIDDEESQKTTGTKRKAEEIEEPPAAKRQASERRLEPTDAPLPPPPKPAVVKTDSIEETLLCQICQEMLHDCVSLQPCMHSYCGGCYSDWMGKSNTCPACRIEVERISKNHIVNNLVAAYIRTNPDKKRPDEDLKDLDAKNKITADMLYPKSKQQQRVFEESDEEDSDDDSSVASTDTSDGSAHGFRNAVLFPPMFHAPPFAMPAPLFVCCQCPGHLGPAPLRAPPPFFCTPHTNHVLCMCCLRPMPDRRHEVNTPPQECEVCAKAFCHMYWGCNKPGCNGCLGIFKELDFTGCFNGVINGNAYESRVLRQWLEGQGKTVADMLHECCARLAAGEYQSTVYPALTPGTHTCFSCGFKAFKELAYQYRKAIPDHQLPAEVTARPDCHWGRHCRTQASKPHHAQNFNHICDQTKF